MAAAAGKMKQLWIIGVGFLGSRLASHWQSEGLQVIGIDLRDGEHVSYRGDAAELDFLRHIHQEVGSPDAIICAQSTKGGSAEDYERCYLRVLENLIELFPQMPALVFCSSTSVYGGRDGSSYDERSLPCPRQAQAEILLQAEHLAQQEGGIILRLAPLYGVGRCALLYRYLVGEMPLAGEDSRILNYAHIDMVAEQLCQLLREGLIGTYNLVSDQMTKGEALQYLSAQTGLPRPNERRKASSRGLSHQRILSCHPQLQARGWDQMKHFINENAP